MPILGKPKTYIKKAKTKPGDIIEIHYGINKKVVKRYEIK